MTFRAWWSWRGRKKFPTSGQTTLQQNAVQAMHLLAREEGVFVAAQVYSRAVELPSLTEYRALRGVSEWEYANDLGALREPKASILIRPVDPEGVLGGAIIHYDKDGNPVVMNGHLEHITLADMRRICELCKSYNCDVHLSAWSAVWCPGRSIGIEFVTNERAAAEEAYAALAGE